MEELDIRQKFHEGISKTKPFVEKAVEIITEVYKMGFDAGFGLWKDLGQKDIDSWHFQLKENIYDSFDDWNMHYFVCLMKDGSTQSFVGGQDECDDGSIQKSIDIIGAGYEWEIDDILFWKEI